MGSLNLNDHVILEESLYTLRYVMFVFCGCTDATKSLLLAYAIGTKIHICLHARLKKCPSVGGGVLKLFLVINVFPQRAAQASLEKQLDLRTKFLRKPIASRDLPGVRPGPYPLSPWLAHYYS